MKSLDILYMLVCISSFKSTTSIHHTSMDIINMELMPCKQTYEMHVQMHHTSSWACSPYLCAQNFSWSLSFVISLPLCHISRYLYVSPLCHYFYYYLCFSPPLSSMTTKVLNRITCRVEIINVNQWGEGHCPKFGSILDYFPNIFNSVWSKDKLLHTS